MLIPRAVRPVKARVSAVGCSPWLIISRWADERHRPGESHVHQLQQREQPDVSGMGIVESAAMAAGLDSLHDQRVGADGLSRARFFHRRHGHPDGRTDSLQPVNIGGGRAAEGERDDWYRPPA